jgi:hypothetical protein
VFISINQIEESLKQLEPIHPLLLITFLVCKRDHLPVGRTKKYNISKAEKEFLEQYHKPEKRSKHYYQVSRLGPKTKKWIDSKYPSSTLQSMRTREETNAAFIHEKNTQFWGWQRNYVQVLKKQLQRGTSDRIPAFHLAVWLYRERDWPSGTTAEDIVKAFLNEFNINSSEQQELFDTSLPGDLDTELLFCEERISWRELRQIIGSPPDIRLYEGGTLSLLELRGIGPARKLRFEPADRINLITGDNGLGKTFILECAWWALTGTWTGAPAYPREDARKNEPKITFVISSALGEPERGTSYYDWKIQDWPSSGKRLTIPGLVIYARVDGAFAVWDPLRNYSSISSRAESLDSFRFTREDVWEGLKERVGVRTVQRCNGLISDWILWQSDPSKFPFETLKKVLRRLSPPGLEQGDLGPLEPGKPTRIPSGESRLIPTIKHSYGEEPLVYASAAVRRIVALAYLIVWTWEEHKAQSEISREEPQRRMVILIDEIEAHLHPQWQRTILPALLAVHEDLEADLQVQLLITTHSPLVLASVEPYFDETQDRLFRFDLEDKRKVTLPQIPWSKQGDTVGWLTSEVFGLQQARSREAEAAIEAAEALMRNDVMDQYPKHLRTKEHIHQELLRLLPGHDPFWPRWLVDMGLLPKSKGMQSQSQ